MRAPLRFTRPRARSRIACRSVPTVSTSACRAVPPGASSTASSRRTCPPTTAPFSCTMPCATSSGAHTSAATSAWLSWSTAVSGACPGLPSRAPLAKNPPGQPGALEPYRARDTAAGDPHDPVGAQRPRRQPRQHRVAEDQGADPRPVQIGRLLEVAGAQPDGAGDGAVLQVEPPGDARARHLQARRTALRHRPGQQQLPQELGPQRALGPPVGAPPGIVVVALPEVDPLAEREGMPDPALGGREVGEVHALSPSRAGPGSPPRRARRRPPCPGGPGTSGPGGRPCPAAPCPPRTPRACRRSTR